MSDVETENQKTRALVAEFMGSAGALIVDMNPRSRSRLFEALVEIGVERDHIETVDTYERADAAIRARTMRLVISECRLGGRWGLELFHLRREIDPDPRNCVLALVTGDSSQSTLAQAAEEDVDAFVLKPYTVTTLKRALIAAINTKLNPSPYLQLVAVGKAEMQGGELEKAMETFSRAARLEEKATLALFYRGQAELMREMVTEATGSFRRGLQLDGIHYKCLIGLYVLLRKQEREADAYEVVRKLARYFPANPKRMSEVLRLAVSTANYPDIEEYYAIFKELEVRSDDLVNHICSGLAVTGKYYLMTERTEDAMNVFEGAATSGAGQPKFLRYIIETLVKFDMPAEASAFLKRFPADAVGKIDHAAAEYAIASCEATPTEMISSGQRLLKREFYDPVIYEIYVKSLIAADTFDEARAAAREAIARFPELDEKMRETLPSSSENTSRPGRTAD